MKKNLIILLLATLLAGCGISESELVRLRYENDSLAHAKYQLETEINDYFTLMNEVQSNIDKIKTAQDLILIQPIGEKTPKEIRDNLTTDIHYVNKLIEENEEKIKLLTEKLFISDFKTGEMDKMMKTLTKSLETEFQKVTKMDGQLRRKDSLISSLGGNVDNLAQRIATLKRANREHQQMIKEQEKRMNSIWYVIGTNKELKKNKIVSSGGFFRPDKVFQDTFDKSYFTKSDKRILDTIQFSPKIRIKLLTNHPKESFEIEKRGDSCTLKITDKIQFWSLTPYLIVETDE